MILSTRLLMSLASNACFRLIISYRQQPRLHMSDLKSYGWLLMTSGDLRAGPMHAQWDSARQHVMAHAVYEAGMRPDHPALPHALQLTAPPVLVFSETAVLPLVLSLSLGPAPVRPEHPPTCSMVCQ